MDSRKSIAFFRRSIAAGRRRSLPITPPQPRPTGRIPSTFKFPMHRLLCLILLTTSSIQAESPAASIQPGVSIPDRFAADHASGDPEAALAACAKRYFGARQKDGGYLIGEDWFPSPCRVLFESDRKRPYHSAILHGDLNTDNIVIARDRRRVTLIEKTSAEPARARGPEPQRNEGAVR